MSNLFIYNSLSKKIEQFTPIDQKNNIVKMYVCGQTVYDYCHLGHARKAIVFDIVRRWLIAIGYHVIFVENITDIDDKIIKRSINEQVSMGAITAKYTQCMHEDFDRLRIARPNYQPKATEYIEHMLEIIQKLIDAGLAYLTNSGDVYYRVSHNKEYGKLSNKNLHDLYNSSRIEHNQQKIDQLDFVLWKSSKPHEPSWDSQFGSGRPGWHTECVAMATNILGNHFDIHGGGEDLAFPHHENEIAQCKYDDNIQFAKYWMHNSFVNVNDEKMAKSIGNFTTIRKLLGQYHNEVIRMFIIKAHYRTQINYSSTSMHDARCALYRLYRAIRPYEVDILKVENDNNNAHDKHDSIESYYNMIDSLSHKLADDAECKKYLELFICAMNDDFNSVGAISILFEIVNIINIKRQNNLAILLVQLARLLGIMHDSAKEFLQYTPDDTHKQQIEQIVHDRQIAKKNKNYQLADQLRLELKNNFNAMVEDSAEGVFWYFLVE